ncbi:MAG TPA: hypothetical protein GXX26_08030 [Clostridiaceae bacterium]|jgi:hypothetical protein|nr:hypothetical protein [Clostridiaceae bacterium]
MSIRPVDYQILMPKVNEVARMQSEEQQRLVGQAQQNADNSVKEALQDIRSVHTQREAQKITIADDQRNRGRDQEKKQGKKSGESEKDEGRKTGEIKLPQEKHTIDIRI